jgi:hypothetical protein
MLSAQNSVDRPRMGVATGLVNFTRQLGGAVGVAVAGAVMLSALTSRLTVAFPGKDLETSSLLAPGEATRQLPASAQDLVRGAFAGALHEMFVMMLVVVVVGAATVVLMPRGSARELRDIAQGSMIEELHEHPEEASEYSLHF